MEIGYEHINKPGFIGVVSYYIEVFNPLSEEEIQKIIDQDSRAAMYAQIQTAMYNPSQQHPDIYSHYIKSRMDARKRAEDLQKITKIKTIYHQVGQKESIEELLGIEKQNNFRGWLRADIISELVML